ncbi:hypothetical protein D9M71_387840 [compost metagenome]
MAAALVEVHRGQVAGDHRVANPRLTVDHLHIEAAVQAGTQAADFVELARRMLLDHEQPVAAAIIAEALEAAVLRALQAQGQRRVVVAPQRSALVRHRHHHQRAAALLGQHQQVVAEVGDALDILEVLQRPASTQFAIAAQRHQLGRIIDHRPQLVAALVPG